MATSPITLHLLDIAFIKEPEHARSNYWLNAIILADSNTRDEFLKATNEVGVMTRPIWRLLNKLDMYKTCQIDALENAQWLEDRVVNIPVVLLYEKKETYKAYQKI